MASDPSGSRPVPLHVEIAITTGEALPEAPRQMVVISAPAAPAPPDVEIGLAPTSDYEATVVLRNEHDLRTIRGIEATLAPIHGNVLVDLSACDFMDSTVIAALIRKSQQLEPHGLRVDLVVPPENANVMRIVEIVGLRAVLDVYDSQPLPV
jgi:anti-anti-sigma factor